MDLCKEYGGNDFEDDSGVFKYVCIEFLGFELLVNNEVNGFIFGSVGWGIMLSYIQVNNLVDDVFEWFGGIVNVDYLVLNNVDDDMFDMDYGYMGMFMYLFGCQVFFSEVDFNGFEFDNQVVNFVGFIFVMNLMYDKVMLCGNVGNNLVSCFGMVF